MLTPRLTKRNWSSWVDGARKPFLRYRVQNPVRWGFHRGSAEGSSLVGVRGETPGHGLSRREREGSFLVGCRDEILARGEAAKTVRGRGSCTFRYMTKRPLTGDATGMVMPLAKMSGALRGGTAHILRAEIKAKFFPPMKAGCNKRLSTIRQMADKNHKKFSRDFR